MKEAKKVQITEQICKQAQLMRRGGANQAEVAALLGINNSTVSRIEAAGCDFGKYQENRKARREKLGAGYVAGCALSACLVLLGVGAYVALNYFVTGDPFRFMTYQREHWGQQLGLFYDTFRYTVENAFSYHSEMWRLYTWIPQAAAMLLSFAFSRRA